MSSPQQLPLGNRIHLWVDLRHQLFKDRMRRFGKTWHEFFADLFSFWTFLGWYLRKKTSNIALRFEDGKDFLVSFLIAKRGRYSKSFLNISFFLLTITAIVVSPVIASSYPGVNRQELAEFQSPSSISTSLSDAKVGASTLRSDKPRDQVMTYTVQKGDTLASIAETFGVSTDSIKWATNIKSDDLTIGQDLKIPPVDGIVHSVKEGDTVYSIAKKYKVDAQAIVNFPFNDFDDLDTFSLRIGQVVIVPGGQPPSEAIAQRPSTLPPAIVPPYEPGVGGTYLWPTVGMITQYPIWYHMAFDIANPVLPAVLAARSGTVVYSDQIKWGYGNHIIVDHGDGYQTLYGHLSQRFVNVGDRVTQGQSIGRMGSTGRSTGPHLHFEIRRNGVPINPAPFFKK